MSSPVEEVVGQPYKPLIRFVIAAGAIFTVISISSDRAKAFVDERVENKVRVLDASVAEQGRRIEKLDAKVDVVQEDISLIKAEVTEIKTMMRSKGR